MEALTIGEVARRAGIKTSAVRYYESLGLLQPPRRVHGRRRYDAGVLQRLALIQLAQHIGFTLAEIEMLLHGFEPDTPPAARWQALAPQKLSEIEALIERAQQMKQALESTLDCGCQRLEDCASAGVAVKTRRSPD